MAVYGGDHMSDDPKRIYGWIDSQLSIARHYGGITVNGVSYVIRYDLEGQPLEEVRPKPRKKKTRPPGTDTKTML
jgi:hypothetical protein